MAQDSKKGDFEKPVWFAYRKPRIVLVQGQVSNK
jgi:hypothetical protein